MPCLKQLSRAIPDTKVVPAKKATPAETATEQSTLDPAKELAIVDCQLLIIEAISTLTVVKVPSISEPIPTPIAQSGGILLYAYQMVPGLESTAVDMRNRDLRRTL